MNTASKNEMNVEAPSNPNPKPILPLVAGKLKPWSRGGSVSVGSVAKFYPKDQDDLSRWIAGMQFRVACGDTIRTVQVTRYVPAKDVAFDRQPVYTGRGRWVTAVVKPRTMPELVVVRVLSFEVIR